MYFISTEPVGSSGHLPTGGPSIWCQLEQENFFNEYKLEGVTPEHVRPLAFAIMLIPSTH